MIPVAQTRSITRNVSGSTKTTLSRMGSRGRVMTSTMTLPLSRRSVTPPRAPAGAASTGTVNSTGVPTAKSSIVAISTSVELGIGGDQSRCSARVFVVPRREHRSNTTFDHQLDEDSIAGTDPFSAHLCDWDSEHCLGNPLPYEIRILRLDLKDSPPFGTVPLLPEHPFDELGSNAPGFRSPGKRLSDFWWPRHRPDARDCEFTRVCLRSILRIECHTKPGRAR